MRRRYLLSRRSLSAAIGSTVYLASYGVVSTNDATADHPRRPVGTLISIRPGGVAEVETSHEWEAGCYVHDRGSLDAESLLARDSSGNGALRQQQERARWAMGAEQREYDAVTQRRVSDLAAQLAYDEIVRNLNQADLTAGPVSVEAAAQVEANVSRELARHLTGASFAMDRVASRDGVVVGVTTVPLRGQALRMSNRFEMPSASPVVTRLSSGNITVSASPTTTAQQVADAVNAATNTPPDAPRMHAAPRSWSVATAALGIAAEAASVTFSGLAGIAGGMVRAVAEAAQAREESMAQFRTLFDQPLREAQARFDTISVTRGSSTVDIVETSPGSSRLTAEQLDEVRRVVNAPTPPLICEAVEIAPSAPQRLLGELMPWLNEEVDMGDEALWQLNSEAAVTGHAVVYVPSRKALRVAARQELLQADAATWRQVDWKRSPQPTPPPP